jgi:hypothetical protein
MTDNLRYFETTDVSNPLIATRDIGANIHIQRVVLSTGPDTPGLADVARNNPLPVTDITDGQVNTMLSEFLVRSDSPSLNQAVDDYSVTARIWEVQPSASQVFRINSLIVAFTWDSDEFFPAGYGKDSSPLTNGITVRVSDGSTLLDLTAGFPIESMIDWAARDGHFQFVAGTNAGTKYSGFTARWDFSRHGAPIRLDGDNDERLEVVTNDDFSAGGADLLTHTFLAHGYVEDSFDYGA